MIVVGSAVGTGGRKLFCELHLSFSETNIAYTPTIISCSVSPLKGNCRVNNSHSRIPKEYTSTIKLAVQFHLRPFSLYGSELSISGGAQARVP